MIRTLVRTISKRGIHEHASSSVPVSWNRSSSPRGFPVAKEPMNENDDRPASLYLFHEMRGDGDILSHSEGNSCHACNKSYEETAQDCGQPDRARGSTLLHHLKYPYADVDVRRVSQNRSANVKVVGADAPGYAKSAFYALRAEIAEFRTWPNSAVATFGRYGSYRGISWRQSRSPMRVEDGLLQDMRPL
jgi:hypothetical protein